MRGWTAPERDRAAHDTGVTHSFQRTDVLVSVRAMGDDELVAATGWPRYDGGGPFAKAVDFVLRERGIVARDGLRPGAVPSEGA